MIKAENLNAIKASLKLNQNFCSNTISIVTVFLKSVEAVHLPLDSAPEPLLVLETGGDVVIGIPAGVMTARDLERQVFAVAVPKRLTADGGTENLIGRAAEL